MSNDKIHVFWFRRDLRWVDNRGFYESLKAGKKVLPIFIFDTEILDELENKKDRRVQFIFHALDRINTHLQSFGSSLRIFHGSSVSVWRDIVSEYSIDAVYTNHDYEPYAIERDERVGKLLVENGISFYTYKDQVIFEKNEVVKSDGKPYTVFTPYSKVWKQKLTQNPIQHYPSEGLLRQCIAANFDFPSIESIGFERCDDLMTPSMEVRKDIIQTYGDTRNFPSLTSGTSRLSVHLRFGTVSIRDLVQKASISEAWLNELIWREFYMQILYHFPYVVHRAFKPAYDQIPWRNNEQEFQQWSEGRTGYPIVDAGMRELLQTGWMHNRVRMIVASFLTKHLLIDWRWGEAFFARHLLDFDLSANNGGWQWAASSGCDAAPYFRIFNPSEQTRRFDKDNVYIHTWLDSKDMMIPPIVEHSYARQRAIDTYRNALKSE